MVLRTHFKLTSALFFAVLGLSAQQNSFRTIKSLRQHKIEDGAISSFQLIPTTPLFWPPDLDLPRSESARFINYISWRQKIYLNPSGTGQLYEWTGKQNNPLTRVDSSNLSGYNFGAFHFIHEDTLFSLGGYGYWQHNGHLRYYSEKGAEWNIQKLQQDVSVGLAGAFGLWYDQEQSGIYYLQGDLTGEGYYSEDSNSSEYSSPVTAWLLDLRNSGWVKKGIMNKKWLNVFLKGKKIGHTEQGELVFYNENNVYNFYLIDYKSNSVAIINSLLTQEVIGLLLADPYGEITKFSWADKSGIHIGPFRDKFLVFKPEEKDLIRFNEPLIISDHATAYSILKQGILIIFLILIGFVLGGLWFFQKNKRPKLTSLELLFNPFESALVSAMTENPEKPFIAEDINLILNTDKKSIEIQKKYRSETIKGVNEKCHKFLDNQEPLILQNRLESDRRQFEYLLNFKVYRLLESKIRQTPSDNNS